MHRSTVGGQRTHARPNRFAVGERLRSREDVGNLFHIRDAVQQSAKVAGDFDHQVQSIQIRVFHQFRAGVQQQAACLVHVHIGVELDDVVWEALFWEAAFIPPRIAKRATGAAVSEPNIALTLSLAVRVST